MRDPFEKRKLLISLLCISIWICLSSVVIVLNKWILSRFPFAITLTTWHMLFATIATQILSRTTSLIGSSPEMDVTLYVRTIIPIGMCFSMSLILSNVVYLYLSMSFVQMLKAIGPVATLLACWSMGLRDPEPSIQVLLTVCIIVMGVAISSLGELHFVLAGFLIQGAAVVFEAFKNALQQFSLNGRTKLSSMTLLFYFAPTCTLMNAFGIFLLEPNALGSTRDAGVGPWIFLVNGCLTFALNIASVTVIKRTSSVVLTLSGIPKSILLTIMDMVFYHTSLSLTQVVGFTIAGAGTYYYSQLNNLSETLPISFHEKRVHARVQLTTGDDEANLLH